VVAKILSQFVLLVAATALGMAACLGVTTVVFDGATVAPFTTAVGLRQQWGSSSGRSCSARVRSIGARSGSDAASTGN